MQQKPTYHRLSLGALLTGSLLCSSSLFAATPDPVIDTTAPTAIAGIATVNFDATGPIVTPDLATEITAGSVVVTDGIDFSFAPTGTVGPLIPGQYTIDWTATDLGINSLSIIPPQIVNVRPTINFGPDQEVGEGGTAVVTAYLSGSLATTSYPVTIPYTIDAASTATGGGSDYNITEGTFQFNGPDDLSDSITFSIINDGLVDPDEDIIIKLDSSLPTDPYFDGHNITHTITIKEGTNYAPLAEISVAQGSNNPTRAITSDGGLVTVSATAYDANGDTIFYDWSASDNALTPVTGTTGSSFTFDPQGLVSGFYFARLSVSDSGGLSSSYDMLLRVITSDTITFTADVDSDDDKTDDIIEGYDDEDNDGIPDYLDADNNPSLMQAFEPYIYNPDLIAEDTLVTDSITLTWKISTTASNLILYPLMIATEPGHKLALGPTAFAAGKPYARMSTSQAELLRGTTLDDGLVSGDGQVVDIEVDNLSQAGGTALIVLPQIAPIPASNSGTPKFIVFSRNKSWETFTDDGSDNYVLTSTKITNSDYCPGLDDTSPYAAIADITGKECLLINIKDGGPNDYDGVANGAVRLMGGVFINSASSSTTTEEEGGLFSGDTSSANESLDKLQLGTGHGGGILDYLTLSALLSALVSLRLSKSAHHRSAA